MLLELENGLGALAGEVDFAFQQMVFHALYVVGAGILLAVQTKGPLLGVILVLLAKG